MSAEKLVLRLREYAEWEINAFLWISLITITFVLLQQVVKLFRLRHHASKIPGPPCSSFYGHRRLLSSQTLTEVLAESHEKYGSVVKLWLGPSKLLVSIKEPALIKEMLSKAEDKLPLTGRAFRLAFGQSNLFVSSFDQVQKRRETLSTELHGRLLEIGNVFPARFVDCVMERLHEVISKGSINCKVASQHMAFTMLGATIFGDEFLAWSKATVYEELLMTIAKDACFWASYSVTPFWKRGFWRYQHLCEKLKCLTQDIIQQCWRNCRLFCPMDQNSPNETEDNGMETVLDGPSCSDALALQEPSGHLHAREEHCGNIMGVMFHGYLSTAGLVGNIMAWLSTHQELQEKIYLEIIMAQKGSEEEDQQSVDKMPLLLATIYESARLLPAGPLLQRCSLKHDLTLKNGMTVPAGTVLVVPVQMDNCSWGTDASQFNPYRFLSKKGKQSDQSGGAEVSVEPRQSSFILNDPNDNAAFLPFGSGSRACVGQKFVTQGIATLFASLLERYEIRPELGSGKDPKLTMKNGVFQLLPGPEIVFVKRDS